MVVPKPKAEPVEMKEDDRPARSRISWARLLKRVFNIDVETCHLCAGQMKIIASIEAPQVIKKILEHLDVPSKPPMPWPARGPPQRANDDFQQFPSFDLT
jgi:CO dehydrogenase/acetyl-CoA synthase delta subunit